MLLMAPGAAVAKVYYVFVVDWFHAWALDRGSCVSNKDNALSKAGASAGLRRLEAFVFTYIRYANGVKRGACFVFSQLRLSVMRASTAMHKSTSKTPLTF